MSSPFSFRPMSADDLVRGHELSTAVQWPHRYEDWQFVFALGEGVVATQENRVVGTSMWWLSGLHEARVGMVIVDPSLQRVGLGRALMERSLAAVGDKTIHLTATAVGAPLYVRLGFKPVGLVRQHQGVVTAIPHLQLSPGQSIQRGEDSSVAVLTDLDAQATGVVRSAVIDALASLSEIAILLKHTKPSGFAMCRHFGRGLSIGPVIADTRADAEALIAYWLTEKCGEFARIDIPVSSGLSDVLAAHGLVQVDEVTPMVRGPAPAHSGGLQSFALINQALG